MILSLSLYSKIYNMATSNFHNENANKVFTIEIEDQEDYDFLLYSLNHRLKQNKNYFSGGEDTTELRSYPSQVLGQLCKSKMFGDIECQVSITMVIRSGYYSGANLDWIPSFIMNGYEIDNSDISDNVNYYSEMKAGMRTIQTKNISNWYDRTMEELVKKVEDMYEELTTPLKVVAHFSNGETIYEKI
jgi:hypothetical protein